MTDTLTRADVIAKWRREGIEITPDDDGAVRVSCGGHEESRLEEIERAYQEYIDAQDDKLIERGLI